MSVDRYKEDLKRTKGIHSQLETFINDRKNIEAQGNSTSAIDHKLKAEYFKLTKEVTQLEKLVYEYENPNVTRHSAISGDQKNKRLKELKPLIESWKKSMTAAKLIQDKKTMVNAGAKIDMDEELN